MRIEQRQPEAVMRKCLVIFERAINAHDHAIVFHGRDGRGRANEGFLRSSIHGSVHGSGRVNVRANESDRRVCAHGGVSEYAREYGIVAIHVLLPLLISPLYSRISSAVTSTSSSVTRNSSINHCLPSFIR